MAPPLARWVLRSAALPVLAGVLLALQVVRAVDKPGWDALGYALLAMGCGVLAVLLFGLLA